MLAAVAILAILTVLAAPSFEDFRVRERLKGAAHNLFISLQLARSEAVERNEILVVSFGTGTGWCLAVHTANTTVNGDCECATATECIKRVTSTEFPGVTLAQAQFSAGGGNVASFRIDPRRGQIVDATGAPMTGSVRLDAAGPRQVRADLNALGRVRLCVETGYLPGFVQCS
jgi:type IV fimbrial biogenesis protein FimT